jgi:hypothetical protein
MRLSAGFACVAGLVIGCSSTVPSGGTSSAEETASNSALVPDALASGVRATYALLEHSVAYDCKGTATAAVDDPTAPALDSAKGFHVEGKEFSAPWAGFYLNIGANDFRLVPTGKGLVEIRRSSFGGVFLQDTTSPPVVTVPAGALHFDTSDGQYLDCTVKIESTPIERAEPQFSAAEVAAFQDYAKSCQYTQETWTANDAIECRCDVPSSANFIDCYTDQVGTEAPGDGFTLTDGTGIDRLSTHYTSTQWTVGPRSDKGTVKLTQGREGDAYTASVTIGAGDFWLVTSAKKYLHCR